MKTEIVQALKMLLDARGDAPLLRTSRFGGDHREDDEPATGAVWLDIIQAGEYAVPGHGPVSVRSTWPASADGHSLLMLRGGLAVAWICYRAERVCVSVRPMRGGTAHSIRVEWVEPDVPDHVRRSRRHAERLAARAQAQGATVAADALHAFSEAGRDDVCLAIVRQLVGEAA
jgi:hypothetical protein